MLPFLVPTTSANHVPRGRPLVTTGSGAQGHHRVHVRPFPMHATPFQAVLHHQLVGTLHRAIANRIALGAEVGIGDL